MSQPTCATCRFFVLAPGNTKWGVCRRFPAIPPRNKPDPADEWCGEHAPRPDESGPGLLLSRPHPLPAGWRWRGEQVVGPEGAAVYVDDDGDVVFESTWYAPPDVLLAVIAAHRARVGGAS